MTDARRVRRVHLTAASDALVRRGAILLEDALRTASLPAASGSRLLVIRSLPVGVIHADASPASLSLVIERRVAELSRGAVYAEDPSADRADAVYFRDDVEAPVLLAIRLARGARADAWFWRIAVPGHRPDASREEGLRAALARALASGAGAFAAVRLVETLASRGLADALLGALRRQEGEALVRALGWSPDAPAIAPPEAGPEDAQAMPALLSALSRWAPAWGVGDPRTVWLAAAALAAGRPGCLLDARLPDRARRLARAARTRLDAWSGTEREADPGALGREQERDARERPGERGDGRERDAALSVSHEPTRAPEGEGEPAGEGEPDRAGSREIVREREDAGDDRRRKAADGRAAREDIVGPDIDSTRPPPERPRVAGGRGDPGGDVAETALGGLLFLLPVLERIGIAATLEGDPELLDLDVPARVLLHVGERLYDRPDDAMLRLLRRKLPDGAADATQVVRGLATEARRWCRRRARIGLRDLVLRPAQVAATETHVDVIFDLRDADIRVRRAGLDIDPGWVPWFGRVVRFHYVRRGQDEG
jgi:hypothetical protein